MSPLLKPNNHLSTTTATITTLEALTSSSTSQAHHKGYGATDRLQQQQQQQQSSEFKKSNHLLAGYAPVLCAKPPFRLAIGLMLVLASTLYHYAANSLAIVSVAMVAGDVRDRGLTSIRMQYLALNPVLGASAALPGTCPIELNRGQSAVLGPSNWSTSSSPLSATVELQHELNLFTAQVQARLESGELIDWTIGQRALMIAAVSLGKLLFALPMGRLSYARGNHLTLLLSLLAAALLAILLPLIVCSTPFWFAALFGMLTGGIAAATEFVSYPLAATWFLSDEASAVTGLLHISVVIGTTLTFFVSGELLSYDLPWAYCFYLPGGLLLALALFWYIFGAERPEESCFVSREELAVLQFSVSKCNASRNQNQQVVERANTCTCRKDKATCPSFKITRKPNWRALLACPTVWTLAAFNFAHSWDTALKSYWSTFFSNILHLDSATSGAFMGLRGLLVLIYSPIFVYSTRKLAINRPFNMSLIALRKSAALLGAALLASLVALLVLLDCNPTAVMVSVMARPLVTSLNMVSYAQVPLDVAPDDGALIMAYTRLVGFGDVLALPVSSGILALASDSGSGNRYTWRLVWLLGLAISLLACLLFVCFADLKPKSYSYTEVSSVSTCRSVAAERDKLTGVCDAI